MEQQIFKYGGYHFIPERRFTGKEDSFAAISRRQRIDSFYAASPDKECDLFRCVENGKLYLPCENDLQEYMEPPQKRKSKERER